MAIPEHELAEHEVTQDIMVRLTEAQAIKLHQAASAKGQNVEEFVISASVHTAEDTLHPAVSLPAEHDPLDSIFGIFKDSPELDALMERIHEEQRSGIAQFRVEEAAESQKEAETNPVIFTSYDGTMREVGGLPPDLGRATAIISQKAASKIWGTSLEEAACHAMQKEK